jgi:Na+/phosphate symporter
MTGGIIELETRYITNLTSAIVVFTLAFNLALALRKFQFSAQFDWIVEMA